jgi:hypothetical protein
MKIYGLRNGWEWFSFFAQPALVSNWMEVSQMCHLSIPALSWPIRVSCHRHSNQSKEIFKGNGEPLDNILNRRTELSYPQVFDINRKESFNLFYKSRGASKKFKYQLRHFLISPRAMHHTNKSLIPLVRLSLQVFCFKSFTFSSFCKC